VLFAPRVQRRICFRTRPAPSRSCSPR
jgi:hypothetical protein